MLPRSDAYRRITTLHPHFFSASVMNNRGSLRYEISSLLSRSPLLFRPYYYVRARGHYRHLIVSRTSELVIEGFPRSANSFAVVAFEQAQPHPVRLAHHLHAPAQIQWAVRWRIPILILIRDPVAAVSSLIARAPTIGVEQAFRQYRRFYRCVERYRDRLTIADFTEITTDYAAVIQRLNRQFGTQFFPYVNSDASDATVFARIDQLNATHGGNVNTLSRPATARRGLLTEISDIAEPHPSVPELRALHRRLTLQTKDQK